MVSRRDFVKAAGTAAAVAAVGELPGTGMPAQARRPNIIFIMADDLGWGELGCYGQKKIRTPNIDRIAAEGIRFTDAYSGSPVCAPSRCVLLTGYHTGHAYIRDNDEHNITGGDIWRDLSLEGQRPILPGTVTAGTALQKAGYRTAAIGKWGLGGPGTTGAPNKQGFDHFFGYLCQRVAHNHYPPYLWRNDQKVMLKNEYFHPHQALPADADPNDPKSYTAFRGQEYSHDLLVTEALQFIRDHQSRPFFLYLPFTIPHVALQVPEDSVTEYEGQFPETPYKGGTGNGGSYLPNRTPHATYAGMITRMDRDVGRVMALVRQLGLDNDTIVFFTGDNGPSWVGGCDPDFFESHGVLRGRKAQVWEGGIRVPLVARWPGKITPGTVSRLPTAFWDMLPTFAELAGTTAPAGIDGVSIVPTLLGRPGQKVHEYLYWEFINSVVVRMGDWKGVLPAGKEAIELYNLASDIGETKDVAAANPSVVARIAAIMKSAHVDSDLFPLRKKKTPA
ncbi:MAG: arylsulfatase [Acidimicrobiia bacterium]|nr:arylsulfatase [Acidimicrobiia bacterium]